MNRLFTRIFAILIFSSLFLLGPIAESVVAQEVFVVPRHSGSLPAVELNHPTIPAREKSRTLPSSDRIDTSTKRPADTQTQTPLSPELTKPTLLSRLSVDQKKIKETQKTQRQELAPEGYFFITGQLEGVGWAKIYLYDHRGGFFDPNDRDADMNLLGTTHLDGKGRFRIGPIQFKNQWYYRGKDIILVLELDSPYAVAYSDIYGTVKPFRYKIAERKRVTPEGGEYELGELNIDFDSDEYYPVRAFDRIVRRLQNEGRSTDQKIRIEFVRDVERPRYMEEIGYILMPYRNTGGE